MASTTTGGLPAPAPIAFLPELSTVFTMPGPPVATSILTSGCDIIALVFSMDGSATVTTRLSGAPTAWSAWLILRICHSDRFLALGCGLKTTELPAASMPIVLQVIVSVGLVVGVIAPTTPKGEYSTVVSPLSPDQASVTRSSTPGVPSAAILFLRYLCETSPIPVSATAWVLM